MRNQKVTAPGVKGFDKRKTSTLKPTPDSGKPGNRFPDVGQNQNALKQMFKNNLKQGK